MERVLHRYRLAVDDLSAYAEISWQRIDALLEDFARRLARAGYGQRIVWSLRRRFVQFESSA